MNKINYNKEDLVSHHGIAAVLKDKDGRILMQEHTKYGFWTIPVGKVAHGQAIEDGLKQEIMEECGIVIEEYKEIISKDYEYNRDGNDVTVYSHLFEITKYAGEVKNKEPQKHKQQVFLSIDQIMVLPYLSDLTLLFLQTLNHNRAKRS